MAKKIKPEVLTVYEGDHIEFTNISNEYPAYKNMVFKGRIDGCYQHISADTIIRKLYVAFWPDNGNLCCISLDNKSVKDVKKIKQWY